MNKKHLNKYLKDHGYCSIDFRKKLSLDDLEALTEYINTIEDKQYANHLQIEFNRLPKKNYFLAIIKKDCGCGYAAILIEALQAYKCKFCSKISGDVEFSKIAGNNPAVVAY